MPETFSWCPVVEPTGDGIMKTKKAQFGDGYKQVAADGINNRSETWPLTFRGSEAYIKPIKQFLLDRGGSQSFYWTPPLGEQSLWTCETYGITPLGGGMYTLTATFDQFFAP
ncbi:phage tail protein [Pseudomonas sp. GD03842]|uniref:phage tail protein n=1 Tax=Pseudomonas sp. GD03842 TaxID=2975385 RepID=UPI002447F6DB|nr:phage tail protein [Pseudomonas sp. GD03842]MDH0745728.1 phage tail protein [Pseudomonas sp. GD03842]